jgi:phage protein D/phage baseplate assembly protein gpV
MADTQQLVSQFYVQIEGLADSVTLELMTDLLEVSVESSLHLPDLATLTLHDSRLRWVDEKAIEPGKGLKISANAGNGEQPLFDGEIIELEPEFGVAAQRLVVRAFDRLHRLSRGRYVRSFVNVSDGDLVQKIAGEVSLQADVGPTTQVHPYVFQNNETNLEFLHGRAAALGYLVYVDTKTLHFRAPKAEGSSIELQWAKTLTEFRPRMTTVSQVSGTTVRGWDPANRQAIVGQAQNGNGTPQVGEKRRGGQFAKDAFNLEAPLLSADRPIRSQAAADALAQALADRHASGFIEAEGSCPGNTKIIAGTPLKISAVGDRFSGDYLVTSAQHTYRPGTGYTTQFTVSGQHKATLLSMLTPDQHAPPTKSLVIGIVTDNKDPDGQGRVKVKYPWLSPDHASDWARVVAPGGGDTRGVEFLPEINDEVLVGFEQGDVHHAYVLGGLWNGQDKPPADANKAVSGGKVQLRVIRSRAGHTITLDDTDGGGGITIADKSGNQIMLDTGSNALKVKTQGDVTIEAQGNLTLRAQGQVEIDGMGVTINGGAGTVDVKGSLINLN